MPAALPLELREQAKELVFTKGLTSYQAAKRLGVNLSTVRNWVNKPILHDAKDLVEKMVKETVNREAKRISNVAKGKLDKAIGQQADALASIEHVTLDDLRNTPERQGLAAVTKTVIESGCLLFGWDKESKEGTVNDWRALEAEVIDVDQSVKGEDAPQQMVGDNPKQITNDLTEPK